MQNACTWGEIVLRKYASACPPHHFLVPNPISLQHLCTLYCTKFKNVAEHGRKVVVVFQQVFGVWALTFSLISLYLVFLCLLLNLG